MPNDELCTNCRLTFSTGSFHSISRGSVTIVTCSECATMHIVQHL